MFAPLNFFRMALKWSIGVPSRHLRSSSRESCAGSIIGDHSSQSRRPHSVKAWMVTSAISPPAGLGSCRKLYVWAPSVTPETVVWASNFGPANVDRARAVNSRRVNIGFPPSVRSAGVLVSQRTRLMLSQRRVTEAQRTHVSLLCGGRHVRATGAPHESKPRKYKSQVLRTSFLYLRGLLSCSAGRMRPAHVPVRPCLRVNYRR